MRAVAAPLPLTDSLAVAGRNLINYRRVPSMMMAATVQPVMTVLLFYYIFGGAIHPPGHVVYVDYLIPGILGWSVVIGAQGTAVGLASDVKSGMTQRMWSLPMARTAFLSGRVIADSVRNLFVMAIVVLLGTALGFRAHGGPSGVVAGVLLMLAFGVAACFLFATIGFGVGDPEGAQAATFPPMILLVFSSSAFVPPSTMPGWLQPYAEHQPLSAELTALRGLFAGDCTTGQAVEALAWIAALLAIFVPLAVRGYRRRA